MRRWLWGSVVIMAVLAGMVAVAPVAAQQPEGTLTVAVGAGAAALKDSSKRDPVKACHHCCRHKLPGPTSSTGPRHHGPYGLTRPTACL